MKTLIKYNRIIVYGNNEIEEVDMNEKPPLGIITKRAWLVQREQSIIDAIGRYRIANKEIPADWYVQLVELKKMIELAGNV